MPNEPEAPPSRPDRRWGHLLLVTVALLGALTLPGCAWVGSPPATATQVPRSVVDGIAASVATRSEAVRAHRRQRFLSTVVRGPARRAQRVWFDNIQQLRLATFSQRLEGPVREVSAGYEVLLRTTVQVAGFDRRPVPTVRRAVFIASAQGWQLVSLAERPESGVQQPWDGPPIVVIRHDDVLVVADPGSRGHAQAVARAVQHTMGQVRGQVPWRWPARVLVQAPSDPGPLTGLANLPGGSGDRLDAVAYRVSGGADGQRFAASRLVLHPRMLTAPAAPRDRVLRHELTHVALGTRNDRLPMWLSEGIAEYTATAGLGRSQRLIAHSAIGAARLGTVALPTDAEFRATASGTQYGLAWYACEVVAQQFGEPTLWRLVDEMAARRQESPDAVLERVLGIGTATLSERASALVRATYG